MAKAGWEQWRCVNSDLPGLSRNKCLGIATMIDPRYKMKFFEAYLTDNHRKIFEQAAAEMVTPITESLENADPQDSPVHLGGIFALMEAQQNEDMTFIQPNLDLSRNRIKGDNTADIVRTTGYKKRTVYDAVKRFNELGNSQDRLRNAKFVDPEQSMRNMASELQISEGSVRNIVKRKLKLRSYKLNKAHFLDERMKL
uniref:Uncharacterized protein n=1 Tax=Globodera rostochiensis TaxID=31243 RepID=A0A914H5H4_GLORO